MFFPIYHDIVRRILYKIALLYHSFRGLDFIRKDTTIHSKYNNGYGFTDWNQLKSIVNFLKKNNLDYLLNNFIDVGCGKGYVLAQMAYRDNARLTGIECVPHLALIAHKNFNILNINNKVTLYQIDALKFNDYTNYSALFLYNPFSRGIMNCFIKKLVEDKVGQEYLIIYVHPQFNEIIMQTGYFNLIGSIYGNLRPQLINIYYSFGKPVKSCAPVKYK